MASHAFRVDECSRNLHDNDGRNIAAIHNSFVVVYLVDIMMFRKTWEEHLHHIRQVLQTLWQYKLCANLEKFTFGMTQVQYLGYIID